MKDAGAIERLGVPFGAVRGMGNVNAIGECAIIAFAIKESAAFSGSVE